MIYYIQAKGQGTTTASTAPNGCINRRGMRKPDSFLNKKMEDKKMKKFIVKESGLVVGEMELYPDEVRMMQNEGFVVIPVR